VNAYGKTLAVFKKILEEEGRLGTASTDELELVRKGLEFSESLGKRMSRAASKQVPDNL
jgi:hypothetical protein